MPRRGMRSPINSVKHFVQQTNATIASGGILSTVAVDAVTKNQDRTATNMVEEGCVIKAIFVEVWIKSNASAGTSCQFIATVEKLVSDASSITATEMANLQSYTNKKNVLITSQGVLGDLTTQSLPIFRQWIAIPKGKQRMGFTDRVLINVAAIGAAIQ